MGKESVDKSKKLMFEHINSLINIIDFVRSTDDDLQNIGVSVEQLDKISEFLYEEIIVILKYIGYDESVTNSNNVSCYIFEPDNRKSYWNCDFKKCLNLIKDYIKENQNGKHNSLVVEGLTITEEGE